jgi:hypothetical protein
MCLSESTGGASIHAMLSGDADVDDSHAYARPDANRGKAAR